MLISFIWQMCVESSSNSVPNTCVAHLYYVVDMQIKFILLLSESKCMVY